VVIVVGINVVVSVIPAFALAALAVALVAVLVAAGSVKPGDLAAAR
jgi:hypothetical protein